jgi:hypothetical protein
MSDTSEKDILSNVPGLEDDSGGDDSGSEGAGSQPTESEESGTASEPAEAPTAQAKEGQPPIVRRSDGLVERQSPTDPRVRDLVDPATGQVVAKGGIERRIFDKATRAEQQANAFKSQLQTANTQLETLRSVNSVANQLKLPPEQQVMAMRVMSDFMKDPVTTIEYLIGEVKAKGYQIPSLNGAGQQTDMAAFQRMLDERLAPMMQERQQQEAARQAQTRAKETLDNFLGQEPDARANLDILANMIEQDQSLSLESAYIRFMRWCMVNQLDPTQPVGPQAQAREQQSQSLPGNQPRQPRPLPTGRPMNGQVGAVDRRPFDEHSEWSDIIKQSMAEAGMQR